MPLTARSSRPHDWRCSLANLMLTHELLFFSTLGAPSPTREAPSLVKRVPRPHEHNSLSLEWSLPDFVIQNRAAPTLFAHASHGIVQKPTVPRQCKKSSRFQQHEENKHRERPNQHGVEPKATTPDAQENSHTQLPDAGTLNYWQTLHLVYTNSDRVRSRMS